jgi:hypothetical protein
MYKRVVDKRTEQWINRTAEQDFVCTIVLVFNSSLYTCRNIVDRYEH